MEDIATRCGATRRNPLRKFGKESEGTFFKRFPQSFSIIHQFHTSLAHLDRQRRSRVSGRASGEQTVASAE